MTMQLLESDGTEKYNGNFKKEAVDTMKSCTSE
jgi:hypothetical protein